ncbi:hypothetical protein [Streptomyces bullii]|uniref:Gliding motility protein n=1 Tax=Streptomyces bullii TaxID=349910 RepID=A0ABW0UR69_9ACTN
MGVFARLLRRSKATGEAPATEAAAETSATGPAAEEKSEAAEAKGSSSEAAGTTGTEPTADSAQGTGTEGVEIPRQQSTEEAADNEAGEGARA